MIIGLAALARSGKDLFADYLVKKYNFKKVNTSDVLRDALIEDNKPATKDNMSILADEWRKQHGMDIVTRRALESIKKYQGNIVVIGLRSLEEVELAKSLCNNFVLVAIKADDEIRYSRRDSRDPQDRKSFFFRDERDTKKKGMGKVIEQAQYTLENNDTIEEFYSKIDKLLKEIQ